MPHRGTHTAATNKVDRQRRAEQTAAEVVWCEVTDLVLKSSRAGHRLAACYGILIPTSLALGLVRASRHPVFLVIGFATAQAAAGRW